MARTNPPRIKSNSTLSAIWNDFNHQYRKETPKQLQLLDGFLAYVLATGILQFVYCVLVGNFPFNSFLSGFICTVGVFVLTGTYVVFGCVHRRVKRSSFSFASDASGSDQRIC